MLEFNDAAQQFPTLLIARLFGFQPQSALASTTTDEERAPVAVKF